MAEHNIIEIQNLRKSYKTNDVLRGVDLKVKKGSIFALLGSNGAGKTTTIKILSTLIKPDSGTAILAGYDVLKQPKKVRENISLTGQYAAIDELLTGRENLKMMGKLLHLKDSKQQIMQLLDRFNLNEAADKRVSTYSGGMKRKIDIAMSLIGKPNILFLDEPTTGLDPQSRLSMWDMIKGLSNSGVTIFLTTQYLDEAEHLAHRISILNKGKIVAEGTNAELKELVPGEILEFDMDSIEDAQSVMQSLLVYKPRLDESKKQIKIETSGNVNEVGEILNDLKAAGFSHISFSKTKASLEDVFLKIIDEDLEAKDE